MINLKNNVKTALIGIITGFANGLFGSGGGTIAVPCMEKFLGVDAHKSHAWGETIAVSIGGIIGGVVGAKLLNKISSRKIHIIFGLAMLAAAVRMFL